MQCLNAFRLVVLLISSETLFHDAFVHTMLVCGNKIFEATSFKNVSTKVSSLGKFHMQNDEEVL